jgi:valyl-tRNA synthetase
MDADDHAILGRLCHTIDIVKTELRLYQFNLAARDLYTFFWGDYCDWYLETAKSRLTDDTARPQVLAVMDLCLRQFLALLHPFMPFITEELWHGLGYGANKSFIQDVNLGKHGDLETALKNRGIELNKAEANMLPLRRQFVSLARALKAQRNLGARRDVKFIHHAVLGQQEEIRHNLEKMKRLIGAAEIEFLPIELPAPDGAAASVTPFGALYLDLAGMVDKASEQARLSKEIENINKAIASSEARLANEAFTSKAPANVIEGAWKQLAENQAKREELKRLLAALG